MFLYNRYEQLEVWIFNLLPHEHIMKNGDAEKNGHFLQHFSTENSVWGLNRAFFHWLRPHKGGGGIKSCQNTSI
jgi:hypothetical protein